ncbi:hypothetical protein [Dokdonella sp.]|uniref:hypothetical protein n=1 Tax=Dokdonella sp. TaxID=2291710 RepID=UPI002F42F946
MVVNATSPPRPAVGERVPAVDARSSSGARVVLPVPGVANALLFLASRCPKCRDTLPEVARLLPLAARDGLRISLVTVESRRRLVGFLDGALALAWARTELRGYRLLNPSLSTPHYLFVDDAGVLVARGDIGDEGWLRLREQLGDTAAVRTP